MVEGETKEKTFQVISGLFFKQKAKANTKPNTKHNKIIKITNMDAVLVKLREKKKKKCKPIFGIATAYVYIFNILY